CPATLSRKIVTEILRNRLGFSGLVVTDALIMGGITKYANPEIVAVMAVEAGTDILLMPDNPEVAIASIYDAVQTGRIKESRIQESLERIWQAKQRIFTHSPVPATINTELTNELSSDRARSTVNSILQNSLQHSARPSNRQLKLEPDQGRNLIVVDDVLNTTYLDLNSPAIAIPQQYNYQRQLVDSNTLDCILHDSRPTLLQVFIRGNPFRGSAGLTSKTQTIYQELLAKKQVTGIVIYGSPYVLDWFKTIMEAMDVNLPWVFTYGQMEQAQAIALQTLFTEQSAPLELESQNFGF
ncbi:MAG: glycoside hydrolase family 3 N-terminal domain-containing protein, partial [Waterburya sp.]